MTAWGRGADWYACVQSPEWLLSGSYMAAPLTVWSLGVLLFNMLCGDVPFHTDLDIVRAQPSSTHHLSKDCQSLILWCLAFDPETCPSLQDILSHSWMQEPEELRVEQSSLSL